MAMSRLAAALADRYRIERELGAGGMATVYLAEDLKHDRKVAVKVLRPELAAVIGAERFLAEIKTTANLQHPHILPLFDSGAADSFLFYVMPFIDGESLRDRLNREKQLPIGDAVRIATEVASALDYAHRHNVIHRDIKPENVLLHDGQALVADFGIALAASKAGGSRMTETGMSLGTPTYMSPEQAMGEREITARSDIYALGAMTYEMLLGEPPFTGPTAQSIVAKVMTEKPVPLQRQRERVPDAVEDAVLTALEKLPADRFGSAAEFADALGGRTTSRRSVTSSRRVPTVLPPYRLTALLVALLITGALAAWGWLRPRPTDQFPSKLAILTAGVGGPGSVQRQLTLTPDGSAVVYVVVGPDGQNRLMHHPLDASAPTAITGSDGLAAPIVSPDGKWIFGTWVGHGPFRLPLEGGSPTPLPAGIVTGVADWDKKGTLWLAAGSYGEGGVMQLVGNDSLAHRLGPESEDLELEQILPGGKALMLKKASGSVTGQIVIVDLKSGTVKVLIDRPTVDVRYTAGYLVSTGPDGVLLATGYNEKSERLTDDAPVTVGTGVSITGNGFAQFAVARNGTVAYIPEEPRALVFFDRGGAARHPLEARHSYHAPMFSPDGRRLSTDFVSADGRDVWILSLDQGILTRATFDKNGHDATWTPDGRFITYSSVRGTGLAVFRIRPGSATPAESLFASSSLAYTGYSLPDNSRMLTVALGLTPGTGLDLAILSNGGHGPLTSLVASKFNEAFPSVSPDGKWVAFVSDQSGQQEVYVRPLEGDGDQVQVSLAGGGEPVWAKNSEELFYRTAGATEPHLVVARFRTVPQFEILSRQQLFSMADIVSTNPHTNYDVSPDGRTFAMVQSSPATRIMIIQNLPGLVERLRGSKSASP